MSNDAGGLRRERYAQSPNRHCRQKRNSYFARIRWTDENDQVRDRARRAPSRTAARNLIQILWSEVEREQIEHERQATRQQPQPRTFADYVGRRAYLRPIIILAIDTAARRGEILGLRRRDIDLDAGLIRLPHTVTKTTKERVVPISERLTGELCAWLHFLPADPEALIFSGIKSDAVTHLFAKVCEKAEISDLHFHDLRHWATTDIVNALTAAGIAPQHAMAITGHSQEETFRRYLRTEDSTVKAAGEALEAMKRAKNESKRGTKGGANSPKESATRSPIQKLRRIK